MTDDLSAPRQGEPPAEIPDLHAKPDEWILWFVDSVEETRFGDLFMQEMSGLRGVAAEVVHLRDERDEAQWSLESLAWPKTIPMIEGEPDIPAHFRSMAARIIQSRDELKHETRKLLGRIDAAESRLATLTVALEGLEQEIRKLSATPMGWQDIESAPKDADVLMLYRDGEGVQPGYYEDGSWFAVETQALTGGRMKPTHWMPFPSPPAETP